MKINIRFFFKIIPIQSSFNKSVYKNTYSLFTLTFSHKVNIDKVNKILEMAATGGRRQNPCGILVLQE